MTKAVIFDMYETLITLYGTPTYFGAQMAQDAGIEEARFRATWDAAEADRSTGRLTLEEVLERILRENGRYSRSRLERMVEKRVRYKEEAFEHMHGGIIPLMEALRARGMRIGLISNCFSEESAVIRRSVLYPYFDAVCLSFDEGVKKPDPAIFRRCLQRLNVQPGECLYVGDGGSGELEAARQLGMQPVQAAWYLKAGTHQPCGRKAEFMQLETPMDVLSVLC